MMFNRFRDWNCSSPIRDSIERKGLKVIDPGEGRSGGYIDSVLQYYGASRRCVRDLRSCCCSTENLFGSRNCRMSVRQQDQGLELHPTIDTSVVWLHVHRFDLSTLNNQSISLRSVLAKDCSRVKLQVQLTRELASWVTQEADATALLLVQGFAPGIDTTGESQLVSILVSLVLRVYNWTYTNASFTATTKTLPASFNLEDAM